MSQQIWFNGELRPEDECRVHVMTHAIHYGSSVFEGIRVYETPDGPRIFRLTDHLKRLYWSASIYRIAIPWPETVLHEACRNTVRANQLSSGYIRPVVMRGNAGMGLIPRDMDAVEVAVIAIPWGAYHGEEALESGIDACISSWQRLAPNTIPAGVKAGGNYLSSQLIGFEAGDRGFAEGIALGVDGLVSEGAGENLFVVNGGKLVTPPVSSSLLSGITRNTVMQLADRLGIHCIEQSLSREQLYAADEIFLTGTAAEITPVRRLDHLPIGTGHRGPVTERLQQAFFGLFDASTEDEFGWLEPL